MGQVSCCLPQGSASWRVLRRGGWQAGLGAHCRGFFVFQVAEPEACDEMYESLARLHSNYYKHKVSGSLSRPSPDPGEQ